MRIGDRGLAAMVPGDVPYDTEIRGFMAGRQRIAPIGMLGDERMTLARARAAAEIMRGQMRSGLDPRAQRDAARAASTLRQAADVFRAEHVEAKLRNSTARGYCNMLQDGRPHVRVDGLQLVALINLSTRNPFKDNPFKRREL